MRPTNNGESVERLDHTQQLPAGVLLNLSVDERHNSDFTLQTTTTTNINVKFDRTGSDNSELLNYTDEESKSDYLTDNKSANFRYNLNQHWGTLQYSSEYSSFGYTAEASPSTPPTQQLWNRLQWMHHLGFADFNLRVDQHMDLGGEQVVGNNTYIGEQRLPEVFPHDDRSAIEIRFPLRLSQ